MNELVVMEAREINKKKAAVKKNSYLIKNSIIK